MGTDLPELPADSLMTARRDGETVAIRMRTCKDMTHHRLRRRALGVYMGVLLAGALFVGCMLQNGMAGDRPWIRWSLIVWLVIWLIALAAIARLAALTWHYAPTDVVLDSHRLTLVRGTGEHMASRFTPDGAGFALQDLLRKRVPVAVERSEAEDVAIVTDEDGPRLVFGEGEVAVDLPPGTSPEEADWLRWVVERWARPRRPG